MQRTIWLRDGDISQPFKLPAVALSLGAWRDHRHDWHPAGRDIRICRRCGKWQQRRMGVWM